MSLPEVRPFCAEVAREWGEPLAGTASRIDRWLLVEHAGYWPYEPLDAAAFTGAVREHLAAQLSAHRPARLLLVKQRGRRARQRFRVFYGRTGEEASRFRRLELDSPAELLQLDLASDEAGEPIDHPLFLVCTHGIRDRCCARYGQRLLRGLLAHAEPEWTWQATHVGGDRFAGNLVILPEALYFGRVGADDVAPILAAYQAGQIDLPRYRGRACYAFAVQAAEGHVRRAAGLTGIGDLRLLAARRVARGRFVVELLAGPARTVHEVEVQAELGEPALLTCKAREPRRPRRFVVLAHAERNAA